MYECGTSDVRTGLSIEDMVAKNYNSLYPSKYAYSIYTSGTNTYYIGGGLDKYYSTYGSYKDGKYVFADTTYFPLLWYPGTSSSSGSKSRYAMCDLFKKRKGVLDRFYVYGYGYNSTTVTAKFKFCLLHQSNQYITKTPSGSIIDISQILTASQNIYVSGGMNAYFEMETPNEAINWDSVDEKVYKDYVLSLCLLEVTSKQSINGIAFAQFNAGSAVGNSYLSLKQKYTPQ